MIQYIITDPCYILPDNIWSECCKSLDDGFEVFNQAVSKALTEFTGHKAWACDTGYGDWTNEIYGSGVIKPNFYADSGMVCVCRLTASVLEYWQEEYDTTNLAGAAFFEMSEDIDVKFDTSNIHWTVVKVRDNQTGDTIQSTTEEEYEEED